jgi:hypothetical protein
MASEWEIKGRSSRCTVTNKEFADGEHFFTLLFRERGGSFRREDWSEEAWRQRDLKKIPFSFWKAKFEVTPPAPETLGKQTAEALLRRYMEEPGGQHANVRYILALMLERKRTLKPIETKEDGNERILIYEYRATGEIFMIPDPQLRLDQIEAVQAEVAGLLA